MSNLDVIFDKHGCDKGSQRHRYGGLYEFALSKYRQKQCTILEIGVQNGASIQSWLEFLPLATIVGCDLVTDFKSYNNRAKIEIGNQEDTLFLNRISSTYGPFDVIIDDGSHFPKSQQISFSTLWPHLKPGGVYFIEDLEVSYVTPYYQSAGFCPTIDYFKSIATINSIRLCNGTEPWIMFAGEILAVFKHS